MRPFFHSLRGRVGLLAAVSAVPLLAAILYGASLVRLETERAVLQSTLRVVEALAAQEDDVLHDLSDVLASVSALVVADSTIACQTALPAIVRSHDGLVNAAIVDADGNVTCSVVPVSSPVSVASKRWFVEAQRSQRPVVSGLETGAVTGRQVLIVAYPVLRAGKLLYASMPIEQIQARLDGLRLTIPASVSAYDKDGVLLGRSPLGHAQHGGEPVRAEREVRPPRGISRSSSEPSRIRLSASVGEGGLYIVADVSSTEINPPLQKGTAFQVLGVSAVLGVLAFGIWVVGTRSLIRPVNMLAARAQSVAAGNLESPDPPLVSTVAELQVLSRAFDEMRENLRDREIERDEAYGTVKRSRDYYLRLLDDFPALIWRAGVDGKCDYFNKAWLVFTGRQLADELEDGWMEGIDSADLQRCITTYVEAFAERRSFKLELRLRRHDGQHRTVVNVGRPIYDDQDTFAGYLGTCYDITDRIEIQRRLEETSEKYRLLFDRNPQPLWVFDRETLKFLAVNQTATRHYGYTREEFLDMSILDIRPPDEVAPVLARVRQDADVLLTVGPFTHIRKDGSRIRVRVSAHDITFEDRPARLILVDDVTEHLQLEEQFRQAQKMEAIGRLAGGVAHDFNNILTAVLGYTERVMDQVTDPALRAHLIQVKRGGERAAALVRQLLAFSRKQLLEPKVLHVNAVIENFKRMLERVIGEDLTLVVSLADDLDPVYADQGQLEQVLMNLVINARDAMPSGGTIGIETAMVHLPSQHRHVPPGSYVRVSVWDTGCGMTPETQARVFEPFFTTKEVGKGTGLGLSTVYGIVKQSDGYIEVSSAPDLGTRFEIFLPSTTRVASVPEDHSRLAAKFMRTGTVLLVEDEAALREMVAEALEHAGYKVIQAARASDAAATHAETSNRIDVMVTDLVLPDFDGLQLIKQVRQRDPDLPVLIMSGYTGTLDLDELQGAGIGFIAKPFTPGMLLRRLSEFGPSPIDAVGA